jgi:hypothetical protein
MISALISLEIIRAFIASLPIYICIRFPHAMPAAIKNHPFIISDFSGAAAIILLALKGSFDGVLFIIL